MPNVKALKAQNEKLKKKIKELRAELLDAKPRLKKKPNPKG